MTSAIVRYDPSIGIEEWQTVYPVSEDSILLIESLEIGGGEEVLEIGCGSGVVSLHCAGNGCIVTAVDINPNAVECTAYNAEMNDICLDVRLSDVYSDVKESFDLIIFNLPYLPVEEEGLQEAAWSGGPDGLGPLPGVLEGSDDHLKDKGRIVIVVSSLMDQDGLKNALEGWDVRVLKDLSLFFEKLSVLEITRPS